MARPGRVAGRGRRCREARRGRRRTRRRDLLCPGHGQRAGHRRRRRLARQDGQRTPRNIRPKNFAAAGAAKPPELAIRRSLRRPESRSLAPGHAALLARGFDDRRQIGRDAGSSARRRIGPPGGSAPAANREVHDTGAARPSSVNSTDLCLPVSGLESRNKPSANSGFRFRVSVERSITSSRASRAMLLGPNSWQVIRITSCVERKPAGARIWSNKLRDAARRLAEVRTGAGIARIHRV